MNFVLLVGAGFSRNWGGWLANEAFEYLLGCPQVDADIRALLWSHRKTDGFEGALATLQQEHLSKKDSSSEERLRKLQDAITLMFGAMDTAFDGINFEFQSDIEYLVQSFLVRFDAIFTLNQDLLLERHYLEHNRLSSKRRWSGWQIPGMSPITSTADAVPSLRMGIDRIIGKRTPDSPPFTLQGSLQPYFKLHGSSNWTDASGTQLLVMGGDKGSVIAEYPVLKWYQEQFKDYLARPDTRLMVIGYSFSDLHINEAIRDAVEAGNLRIFIIDPLGLDVIVDNWRANPPGANPPGLPLLEQLGPNVIGASRRSLREIFGTDRVEHGKVMRFFS
jgi:hypothetical protein